MNDFISQDSRLAAEEEDNLAEQLRFLRRSLAKHKKSIFGIVAAISLLTTLVVFSLEPVYRSTVTLLIETGKAKVVSIEEVYSGVNSNRDHIQTQFEIIQSPDLIRKLVQKLKLAKHPAFDPRQKQGFSPGDWLAEAAQLTDEDVEAAVVKAVSGKLSVQLVRNTQLIKISFDSTNPLLAARIANGLADTYIVNDMESRVQMTQKASEWLTERLEGLRSKLADSEEALQKYRETKKIVDAKGVAMSGAARQLEDVTSNLVVARQKLAEAENVYNQVQDAIKANTNLESIPAIMRNPTIQRFKETEGDIERKISELSNRYGKEHPKMMAAESELKAAKENTRKQIGLVVDSVSQDYEIAQSNVESVRRAFSMSKADIQSMNRSEFELGVLEREVASNKQLYDMFLNRFKETNIAGDMQSQVARVVDPATVSKTPVYPRKGLTITVSLLVALILAVMLAALLEYLDNTVKTGDDVEAKLASPLLGVLPKIKVNNKHFELQRTFLHTQHPGFLESVRTIRTGVLMSALDNPHKVLMVTSSVPEEGKTSTATNLAFALGQLKRVCLVDADMRRPSIGKILGLDANAPGLSSLVAGTEPAEKCIHKHEESGIHVIPSGVVPPNPLELLSSKRFGEVIHKLQETFDMVVIDCAPLQLVSDSLIISKYVNAVVYVVHADSTPYQIARVGIERLKKADAHLLGVVLNQLDVAKADKYYGYGKHSVYGKDYALAGYGGRRE